MEQIVTRELDRLCDKRDYLSSAEVDYNLNIVGNSITIDFNHITRFDDEDKAVLEDVTVGYVAEVNYEILQDTIIRINNLENSFNVQIAELIEHNSNDIATTLVFLREKFGY